MSGTLDIWRRHHFGAAANSSSAADEVDPDGDGLTNAEEFAANTNPWNATSTFKVSEAARTETGYTVVFEAQPGRRYELQRLLPTPGAT